MDDPTATRAGWQLYALGSAAFAATTAILAKLAVAELNPNLATFLRTAVILTLTAAVVTARGQWEWPEQLSRRGLVLLVLSGCVTGLSWLCYFRAMQMAPASRVDPLDKLSGVLVVIFAVGFLDEPLTGRVAVGVVLVAACWWWH